MNIIKAIENEIKKGNTLIDKNGNFTNYEKARKNVLKSYTNSIKDGTIEPAEINYNDYEADVYEENYYKSEEMKDIIVEELKDSFVTSDSCDE